MNLKNVMRAVGYGVLAMAPTGLIFGFITWTYVELWYFMLVLHCLGFVGLVVLLLLPEERQWRFIEGFAKFTVAVSKNQSLRPMKKYSGRWKN